MLHREDTIGGCTSFVLTVCLYPLPQRHSKACRRWQHLWFASLDPSAAVMPCNWHVQQGAAKQSSLNVCVLPSCLQDSTAHGHGDTLKELVDNVKDAFKGKKHDDK